MNVVPQDPFPQPVLNQDDKKARLFIWLISIIIFAINLPKDQDLVLPFLYSAISASDK